MPTKRISKRSVDQCKPQDKDSYLWDDELAGFGVKITPKGRKVYLIQYRVGGYKGRTRRVTIGPHGTLTPDEARRQAKDLLGQAALGGDPAETIAAKADEPTLATLFDGFLHQYADAKLKPSTAAEYLRIYLQYIKPVLGAKRVKGVARQQVSNLHVSLKEKPYQANRVLSLLSKFFNWSELHGYRDDNTNPCRHVKKFKEHGRDRYLSGDELARLGTVLSDEERTGGTNPYVIAALRLLILSGARHSEVLTLKWSHVDIEQRCLKLPESKTGKKTIYLSDPAMDVLAEIPRQRDNPYVICGNKPGAHLVNLQKPWHGIRKAAGLDDVRIHDLRHSYASVAASGGQSLTVIGKLLGHTQSQTTLRYAHLAADPVREANAEIGRKIADAMRPVRPIRKAG